MWGYVHSVWGRACAAATVIVVAATPGLSSAATATQVAGLGSASGGAVAVSVEQTGPRDVEVTNEGEQTVPFNGAKLRRLARALRLDGGSTCFTVRELSAGASCQIRLRKALGPEGAATTGIRAERDADGLVVLTNTGSQSMSLPSRVSSSLLRRLGVRGGDCPTTRTLEASGSCTLQTRAGATSSLRTLRAATARHRPSARAAASQWTELEDQAKLIALSAVVLIVGVPVFIVLLPVIVPVVYVVQIVSVFCAFGPAC